jgi:long-subunit fatty acid transport protein
VNRPAIALSAVLVTAATTAVAQEISLNRPGSGARAAGMGNAFIAISDDGTAASWNPAGLSQLRKPEFSLVHTTGHRDISLEGYRSRDDSAAFTALATASTVADLEFASAAVPFSVAGKPVTLQAGWRRLYQLTSRIQGDVRRVPVATGARPASVIRLDDATDGKIDVWSLAGAVRFTSRLSLGFSLDHYDGEWDDRSNDSEDPGVLGPTDLTSSVISNSVSGNSLGLGLLLAYPSFRVGVVYHGPLKSDYEVSQSTRSSLAEPVEGMVGPVTLHFPGSIGLGVAWRPKPLLQLALDFTFDEWTQFLVESTPGSSGVAVSGFDNLPPDLSATRDTVTVNAGMEKLFPVQGKYVPLRLGASYEPQGGRDPLLRDGLDYFILATGTGLNTNSFKLDLAVEYRWGSYHNSTNLSPVYRVGRAAELGLPPPPEAQGSAALREWRLKLSVIYRVTNTGKMKDVVRKIFGS